LGAMAWSAYALLVPTSPASGTLTYGDSLAQVRGATVAGVTSPGQNVIDTYNHLVTWPPPAGARPAVGAGIATPAPTPADGKSAAYTCFTTVLSPFLDGQLLPLLEQQEMTVSAKTTGRASWPLNHAINLLPMLAFIGVVVMMGREARRGQQSLLGSGGNRAQRYSSERHGVT